MKITETQQRAFARNILEVLRDHEQELDNAGFKTKMRITQLEQQTQEAEGKEAAQVAARKAHLQATADSQTATETAYASASATVELIVGLLGKDHKLVKVLKNLRDEMALEAARGKKKETK
jgi:SepF-like predicted cell division protein (DUF552 family)